MLNIALFGPPGAGKGTQSKRLIEKYNLAYISTGDILRKEIAEGTELGMKAKDIIERGGLVDDEIIVQIIESNITKNNDVNGFLFDGFPRTTVQAYILEGLLFKLNTKLSCMLSLEVPKDELKRRMLERAKTSGRADDNEEVINNRLREYEEKTVPVKDFYKEKGIYYDIDGTGTVDEVFDLLCEAVDDTIRKSKLNVVLIGAPGSGKGVQGKQIAEKFNLAYISTGSLLREEIEKNTEMGKSAKTYMEKGDIVPDEIAIKLIRREIEKNPKANGFIFKGFPRTLVQAYILDGILRKMGTSVSTIIDLNIPTLESIKRLSARGKTFNRRSYDTDTEIIIHRLEMHEKTFKPVEKYYNKNNNIIKVDGVGTQEEVFERLSKVIEQEFKKAR